MTRLAVLTLMTFATVVCCGCQTTSDSADHRPRETSIPWNRPQSWEGQGAMGGAMPQSR